VIGKPLALERKLDADRADVMVARRREMYPLANI
jgi:hypothetical protein